MSESLGAEQDQYYERLSSDQLRRSYWNKNVSPSLIRETLVEHPPEVHDAHLAVVTFMLGRQTFNEVLSVAAIKAPDIDEFERIFKPLVSPVNLKGILPQNYRGIDIRPTASAYPAAFVPLAQAEERVLTVSDAYVKRRPDDADRVAHLYIDAATSMTKYGITQPDLYQTRSYIKQSEGPGVSSSRQLLGAAMLARIVENPDIVPTQTPRRKQSDIDRERREVTKTPEALVHELMEFGVGGSTDYLRMRCTKTVFAALDNINDTADEQQSKLVTFAKEYLWNAAEKSDLSMQVQPAVTLANMLTPLIAKSPGLADIQKVSTDNPAAFAIAVDRILYAAKAGVKLDMETAREVNSLGHAARLYAAMASPNYSNVQLSLDDLKVRFPGLHESKYAGLYRYSRQDSDEVGLMRHYMQMTAPKPAS